MAISNPPVRIAFCITDLDPGGAERALAQLVTRARFVALATGGALSFWRRALADELRAAGRIGRMPGGPAVD